MDGKGYYWKTKTPMKKSLGFNYKKVKIVT